MKRKEVLNYLKEITIVVIGVLIAVSISNYKERLEDDAYLKKTLRAIEGEMVSSRADVDTVLTKHIDLYENLENQFEENAQTLGEFIMSSGGIQIAVVKNVSLRFFISNKAELLEFDVISQLLEIESLTNLYSLNMERLTAFAYDNIHSTNKEVMTKFSYLLSDVIDSEQTLMELYEEFSKENQLYLTKNEE
jgi:hypothetical protein